jgi:hypothetical protein
MSVLPNTITHYFDPRNPIGLNICELDLLEAEKVLNRIRQSGSRFLRDNYLGRRHDVENWLLSAKSAKLGRTPLRRPIYFFLGDFPDGGDPSRPAALKLPMSLFSGSSLTFTVGDSMSVFLKSKLSKDSGLPAILDMKEAAVYLRQNGLPQRPEFVEVQVWDDGPIKRWQQDLLQHSSAR